jgi:hypothetical protein
MNRNYISHIAEIKAQYHKSQAKIPYEEKLKIIIELQKIDIEMRKNNKRKTSDDKFRMIWQPTDFMFDDK